MRISDYVPAISWLRRYQKVNLRSDFQAGLTIGIMVIPSGMAYGMLAGLPPIYGLYAAMIPMLLYGFLGTSKQLVIGPAAVIAILVASGVGTLAEQGSEQYITMVLSLSLMVGIIQMVLGAARLGFLVNFLSHPVLSGFISAASLIIIFSQLKHLTAIDVGGSHLIYQIIDDTLNDIGNLHWLTLAVGLCGMAIIYTSRRIHRALPAAIFAVALGILAVYFLKLDSHGVLIVGEVPSGLPKILMPDLSGNTLQKLLPTALTIAFIGILESIVIAKAMQKKFKNEEVLPNQEFRALGIANIVGSFFQAFPAAGSFSRTAINAEAGGRTPLSSIIGALMVALTLLILTPFFYYLPNAILASVIIMAVVHLIDIKEALFLFRTNRTDFLMLLATFLATLLIGIEEGILIGIVLSLVMVIYKSTRPHIALLGQVPGSSEYRNIERFNDLTVREDILIVRFDAPLYFANADQFKRQLHSLRKEKGDQLKLIIINAESITDIDSTAIHLLQDVVDEYEKENIAVHFSGLRGPVRDALTVSGFKERVGKGTFFLSVQQAVEVFDSGAQSLFEQYTMQSNK